jgi:hypothetical protein
MRPILSMVLSVLFVAPLNVAAEPLFPNARLVVESHISKGGLLASGKKEVERIARAETAQGSSTTPTQESWPGRHPVLTGALVGAGIGAVLGYAACPSNGDCTCWRGSMAAAGAGEVSDLERWPAG